MRPKGPHVCPSCGERVTMLAAGCALCGALLDPRRAQSPSIVSKLPLRLRLARVRRERTRG